MNWEKSLRKIKMIANTRGKSAQDAYNKQKYIKYSKYIIYFNI